MSEAAARPDGVYDSRSIQVLEKNLKIDHTDFLVLL